MTALSCAVIVVLVILAILALVGIIFANGVSVLLATYVLLGFLLVVFCGLSIITGESIISADAEKK